MMKKRIMSLLMALVLCLSLLPTMALAGKVTTYPATNKTISKNQDGKCTVTLNYTDDEQQTYIWHFTLNSDSYVSGQKYSDFTDETASIEGTGKDEPFHSASITITDVDDAPVMIEALIKTGKTGNVDYKVQWTLDQTHDGITFKPWLDTTSLPTKAGDYYLLGDVTLSETWRVRGTTNLCLNGHVIKMNGSGSVITVNSDKTLNLYDCAPDATHIGDYASLPAGGCITGGSATNGGGVYVNGGTFTMEGGSIADNAANSGGGVYVDSGSFTMNDGSIIGNIAHGTGTGYDIENGGAGVAIVENGSFKMSGGVITGNKAEFNGYAGGVYVGNNNVIVGGTAKIAGNLKNSISGWDAWSMSNVYLTNEDPYYGPMYTIAVGTGSNGVAAPKDGMFIGVRQSGEVWPETTLTFTSNGSAEDVKYFFSDEYDRWGYDEDDEVYYYIDVAFDETNEELQLRCTESYELFVGYIPANVENKADIPHVGGGTISYTPATNDAPAKLTLNNAQIAVNGEMWEYAVSSGGDLVIELIGNNQIGGTVEAKDGVKNADEYNVEYGINSYRNITFVGGGTLKINAGNTAINSYAYGSESGIVLDEAFTGTVDVETCNNDEGYTYASIHPGTGLTINGGTLNVKNYGAGCGIEESAVTFVTVNGGKLNVDANSTCIDLRSYGIADVNITGGEVNITSKDGYGMIANDVTISGGETDIDADGYGIAAFYDITISGGETDIDAGVQCIAAMEGDVIIENDAEVTVTAGAELTEYPNDEVIGIYAYGDVTIKDEAKVNATAGNEGYYGDIIGGCVDNSFGISGGSVKISGGTVKAKAMGEYGSGICGNENPAEAPGVFITGGAVTAEGSMNGITAMTSASTISVTDGIVKAKGQRAISILSTSADALTIGSEAKPMKLTNAMRMVMNGNSFEDEKAITAAKGGIALANTMAPEYFAGVIKPLSNAVDDGFVTITEGESTPPSGGSSTPTVTVPVAGDQGSVKVQATVSGSNATVKNVTAEQLDKVGTDKEVTIDLSGLNKSVTGVTFPKTTLENIAASDADGLEVKLPNGTTAVFDKTTVAAIAEQAAGSNIQLVIDTTLKAAQVLTGAQKSAIQGMKSALVLEAYFTSNGKRIPDFKGGEAELTVSYPTTKPVRVWYLTEAGALEEVPSSFDGKSASFVVKHFSNYVIEQLDGTETNGYISCPKDSICVYAKFTDASTTAWYHDGVHYCVENGMMNGVSATEFAPNATLTRGMVVTVLARLSGVDTTTDGVWYLPGQEWAVANGISDGTNMTANITREQLATMLYRYAQLKGIDTNKFTENTNTLSYTDVFTISDWATSGMHFCIAAGVVSGDNNGMLNPRNTATRAEAAAMFQRLGEKVLAK